MKNIIRLGADFSVGHCWPPGLAVQGSPNVFVQSIPAVRVGDSYAVHPGPCGDNPPHAMGPAITGSMLVFINNQPVHRKGDLISCGDIANGYPHNVFAG